MSRISRQSRGRPATARSRFRRPPGTPIGAIGVTVVLDMIGMLSDAGVRHISNRWLGRQFVTHLANETGLLLEKDSTVKLPRGGQRRHDDQGSGHGVEQIMIRRGQDDQYGE